MLQTAPIAFDMNNSVVSAVFYSVTKQIVEQAQWLLDEKLDELMEPITDENRRHLIQIDNIFSVSSTLVGRRHISLIPALFQALGIVSVEGIAKLRDYMLPHAKCVKCSSEFNETANVSENTCEHRFALERSTVLMHLENFLTEMQQQRGNKIAAPPNRRLSTVDKDTSLSRLIDPADIKIFWKSYETILPHETESLWNIIENGLNKYLLVSICSTRHAGHVHFVI